MSNFHSCVYLTWFICRLRSKIRCRPIIVELKKKIHINNRDLSVNILPLSGWQERKKKKSSFFFFSKICSVTVIQSAGDVVAFPAKMTVIIYQWFIVKPFFYGCWRQHLLISSTQIPGGVPKVENATTYSNKNPAAVSFRRVSSL